MAVKRPSHEADHIPPPSAELKDQWSSISTNSVRRNITLKIRFTFVLPHYATNRQVAGSIPDGATGIFQ